MECAATHALARLMRPIQLAKLDETRPVVVLTRERTRVAMSSVTVTTRIRIRGLDTEVPSAGSTGARFAQRDLVRQRDHRALSKPGPRRRLPETGRRASPCAGTSARIRSAGRRSALNPPIAQISPVAADEVIAMTFARHLLSRTLSPPPRYFGELSVLRRAWESVGCAAVTGAVSGFALGASLWLYLGTAGLASVGGIPAATQHRTLRAAMVRATVGGFVWAALVLVVFLTRGHDAVTTVPDPIGWYLLLATLPATAVGWLVWTLADRVSRGAPRREERPTRTRQPHPPVAPLLVPAGAAPRG